MTIRDLFRKYINPPPKYTLPEVLEITSAFRDLDYAYRLAKAANANNGRLTPEKIDEINLAATKARDTLPKEFKRASEKYGEYFSYLKSLGLVN